jgi:hypothetical protein
MDLLSDQKSPYKKGGRLIAINRYAHDRRPGGPSPMVRVTHKKRGKGKRKKGGKEKEKKEERRKKKEKKEERRKKKEAIILIIS